MLLADVREGIGESSSSGGSAGGGEVTVDLSDYYKKLKLTQEKRLMHNLKILRNKLRMLGNLLNSKSILQ